MNTPNDPQTTLIIPGRESLKSARVERFCQEYVNNGQQGAKAAIVAGYSDKKASNEAWRLKQKRRVAERIAFLAGQRLRHHDLGVDDFVRVIKEQINFDVKQLFDENGNLIPVDKLPPELSRCIVGVDVRVEKTTIGEDVTTITEIHKYKTEGRSRYNEQLGRYLTIIRDMDQGSNLNDLLKKADEKGEDLYLKSLENKATGKEFDHTDDIQNMIDDA